MLIAVIVFVFVYVLLKGFRAPEWVAAGGAVATAVLARPYLPDLDGRYLLWAIGVFLLLPYWMVPVIVWWTQRFSATPTFELFDPSTHGVPESVATGVDEMADALVNAGFLRVADLFQTGKVTNVSIRVALLEKQATRQVAIAAGMFSSAGATRVLANYVELSGGFSDGRVLMVNNSPSLGVYARVPDRTVEQFRMVRDPARLSRVHMSLMERERGESSVEPPESGDPAAILEAAMVREVAGQLSTGYFRLDSAANAYRPTVKGAFLMTWKSLPPLKTILERRSRRRAAMLLSALGLDHDDDQPMSSLPSSRTKISWATVIAVGLLSAFVASGGFVLPGIARPRVEVAVAERMTFPNDFSVPDDFPGAVLALEELVGSRTRPLTVRDSTDANVPARGVSLDVAADRADALILGAQPLFLEKGFFLFRHEPNYGLGGRPDGVALVPVRDQFEVVSIVGTNGVNFGISTANIVAWLKELERDEPFVLFGIGYDHVEGRFLSPISDADSLARRFHKLCPDIVDQGTGTVAELAGELRRFNTFFCWWD